MGRRKGAAEAAGDAPPAKKTRAGSGLVEGMETRWEFEDQPGKWLPYSDDFHSELITGFNGKRKEVVLTLPDGKTSFVVNFQKSVQKNKKTSYEKRFRVCFKDESSNEWKAWQWEDEHGRWNPYSLADSLRLEKAQRAGESTVDIEACHRSYTVSLATMEQENTVTKVKRKVARATVDGTAASTANGAAGTPAAATPSASTSSASATASVKQEEEEEEKKPAAKSTARGGRGKSKAVSGGKKEDNEDDAPKKSTMRTLVKKTKAPVDAECSIADKVHVFCEGNDVWDCMLNQTNVGNNNNKYFIIQLLEEDGKKSYYTWFRWGRVGYKGQNSLTRLGPNLDQAKKSFCKKFSDKTRNDWALRKSFVKVPGKYDLLEMDYDTKKEEEEAEEDAVDAGPGAKGEPAKVPDSSLDARLQDLINLICDIKSMEEAMVELKYDAKKAPLGKLTADQIKAGYSALKKVEACVEKSDFGHRLVEACNEFYTRIPHNFGMRTPPLIRTKQEIKEKLQLLEALEDIEIAIKKLKQGDLTLNPVDRHYQSLDLDLDPLNHSHPDFKLLEEYLTMTHADTHNQYKMQLLDVFTCCKDSEVKNFMDHGNRMLLWHGSRLTNWVGILSQGLRIAPPEAPVTGYMFGKGVYFADMSSKSANYCFASRAKNVGLLLVCEVSLGTMNELLNADYKADKLPAGKHSVKGVGKIAPDPSTHKKLSDGTVVPVGKGKDTGVVNPTGYTLNYNEFIVYDTKQIKMRYLLKVKFNFK